MSTSPSAADDRLPWLILYDSDCRFCLWSLAWVLRRDRRRLLEPVALGSPRADAALESLSEPERMTSWHLVAPDRSVSSAGRAVAVLLRLLGGRGPAAAIAERLPGTVECGYRLIADNRGRLGRLLGDRAIARAATVVAERGDRSSTVRG